MVFVPVSSGSETKPLLKKRSGLCWVLCVEEDSTRKNKTEGKAILHRSYANAIYPGSHDSAQREKRREETGAKGSLTSEKITEKKRGV